MDVRLSERLGLVADAQGLTQPQADAEGMGALKPSRAAGLADRSDMDVKTAIEGVAAFFEGEFHKIESVVPEAIAKRPGGQLQTDECSPTFSHCYVHQDGGGFTGDDFHGTVYFHLGDAEYLAVGY